MKKALFALGIIMVLIGAFLMIEGSILGERTIPAAVILVIVGICIITTSSAQKVKKS